MASKLDVLLNIDEQKRRARIARKAATVKHTQVENCCTLWNCTCLSTTVQLCKSRSLKLSHSLNKGFSLTNDARVSR